jgi:hypothetical protein
LMLSTKMLVSVADTGLESVPTAGVGLGVGVLVNVGVTVGVSVGVAVSVGVCVGVGVGLGVSVGSGGKQSGTAAHPHAANSGTLTILSPLRSQPLAQLGKPHPLA